MAITWPLVTDPAHLLVGGARTDGWNSLWGLWFVEETHKAWPQATTLLDWPGGGRLAVADPLNALLAMPLTRVLGPVVAYAVLVLSHLSLGGFAADRLGRACGGGGLIAGVGYLFAPICLAHLQNGSSEAVSLLWLPLSALAMVRATERGGAWVPAAGILLGLCALGGWYAGVGAWLFFGGLLLLGFGEVPLRARLLRLAPVAILALLITLPFAIEVRATALAADGLVDIKSAQDLGRIRRTLGAADPRIFFTPGAFRSPDFAHLLGNPSDFVHTAYLGWSLLVLAILGARRDPTRSRAWAFAVIGGIVLAMGPVLVVNGLPLAIGARAVALPLPYRLLEGLPGFSSLSLLFRLATVSSLGIAVLADRARPRWLVLILAELLLVGPARGLPAVTSVPHSPALAALADAAATEGGAVLNLPPTASRGSLYEQTLHGQPTVGSVNTGINRAGLKVLTAARKVRDEGSDPGMLQAEAQAQGIRWAVLHKDILMDDSVIEAAGEIRRRATLVAEDDRVRVYRLY